MSLPSSSPSFMPTAFSTSANNAAHPTTTTTTATTTRRRQRKRRARWRRNTGILDPTLFPHAFFRLSHCGNDRRRGGKGKQEGKRSKALCLKSEGLAADPTTISRSLQDSRRRAAKKGGEEGSPATKGKGSTEGAMRRTCKREDGKGWRCGNEAMAGSTLCEHHLSQVRSYCKRPSNGSSKRRSPSMPEVGEGRRKQPIAQSSSSTTSVGNDCYYYYYSGFGPAWRETKRKRVSVIAEVDGTDDDNDDGGGGAAAAAAGDGGGGGVNGEGGEDGGKGKIKGRKRVKCRSLKSLL